MLLPGAPANTRCSVCRFDPGVLMCNSGRRQERVCRAQTIRQRPGNIGSRRTAWWWMQSDANPPQHANFPDNRENNREFCRIRPSTAIFMSDQRADSMPCSGIPYATEQGIFKRVSGNFSRITGNLEIFEFRKRSQNFCIEPAFCFHPPRERVLDNYRRPGSCAPSTICQNPYLRPCLALSSAWKAA